MTKKLNRKKFFIICFRRWYKNAAVIHIRPQNLNYRPQRKVVVPAHRIRQVYRRQLVAAALEPLKQLAALLVAHSPVRRNERVPHQINVQTPERLHLELSHRRVARHFFPRERRHLVLEEHQQVAHAVAQALDVLERGTRKIFIDTHVHRQRTGRVRRTHGTHPGKLRPVVRRIQQQKHQRLGMRKLIVQRLKTRAPPERIPATRIQHARQIVAAIAPRLQRYHRNLFTVIVVQRDSAFNHPGFLVGSWFLCFCFSTKKHKMSCLSLIPPELLFGLICDFTDDPAASRLALASVSSGLRSIFFHFSLYSAQNTPLWNIILHNCTRASRGLLLSYYRVDYCSLQPRLLDLYLGWSRELFVALNEGTALLSIEKAANVFRALQYLGGDELRALMGAGLHDFIRSATFLRANLLTFRVVPASRRGHRSTAPPRRRVPALVACQ